MIILTAVENDEKVLLQKSTLSSNGIGPITAEPYINDKTVSYPVTILCKTKLENLINRHGDVQLYTNEKKKSVQHSSRVLRDTMGI